MVWNFLVGSVFEAHLVGWAQCLSEGRLSLHPSAPVSTEQPISTEYRVPKCCKYRTTHESFSHLSRVLLFEQNNPYWSNSNFAF